MFSEVHVVGNLAKTPRKVLFYLFNQQSEEDSANRPKPFIKQMHVRNTGLVDGTIDLANTCFNQKL